MSRVGAYNYNYYQFTSLNPLEADKANIFVDGVDYVLFPDKAGLFTLNTYEYTRELFKYSDTFGYVTTVIDANQSRDVTFVIDIILKDGTIEGQEYTATFFNGAFQRWECPFVEDGVVNLSEIQMPYWEGYPFEYSNVIGTDVERVLVSDGSYVGSDPNVRVIKKDCNGFYLKFHNSRWGYSYYLFEPVGVENFNTKSLGDVREHCVWTDNYLDIGKDGQREISLFSYVDVRDREIIKSLAKSNEVYLYTGNAYDIANQTLWLEVKVESMKVRSTNRNNTFEQLVTIQLPKEQTRTRV